jgi:hypothetical protein
LSESIISGKIASTGSGDLCFTNFHRNTPPDMRQRCDPLDQRPKEGLNGPRISRR